MKGKANWTQASQNTEQRTDLPRIVGREKKKKGSQKKRGGSLKKLGAKKVGGSCRRGRER